MSELSIHDATVDALFEALSIFARSKGGLTILKRQLWTPHIHLTSVEERFDILVVGGEPVFEHRDGKTRLTNDANVITAIDVLDENYEPEFYDKPDLVRFSLAQEYVIYDPTGEYMRPRLSAALRDDHDLNSVRTAAWGFFFSDAGYRLNVNDGEALIAASGAPRVESKLLEAERVFAKHPNPSLSEKIEQLRAKLLKGRKKRDI